MICSKKKKKDSIDFLGFSVTGGFRLGLGPPHGSEETALLLISSHVPLKSTQFNYMQSFSLFLQPSIKVKGFIS